MNALLYQNMKTLIFYAFYEMDFRFYTAMPNDGSYIDLDLMCEEISDFLSRYQEEVGLHWATNVINSLNRQVAEFYTQGRILLQDPSLHPELTNLNTECGSIEKESKQTVQFRQFTLDAQLVPPDASSGLDPKLP